MGKTLAAVVLLMAVLSYYLMPSVNQTMKAVLAAFASGAYIGELWQFFIATGIGQLPATTIYSCVGSMLTGGARLLVTGLLLSAISALIVYLKQIYKEKREEK